MAEETAQELVHYEVSDRVATITLDSPHNRNALSRQLVGELLERLQRADKDDEVIAVLLQATGTVFCSGADLSEASVSMEEGPRAIVRLQRTIVALTKPVVCRLQGPVRAGGTGLVAASDIAIAAESANFALTEVRLALAPAAISLTVLPRLAPRQASWAALTGAPFGATEAERMGLVTRTVPDADLDDTVEAVLADLRQGTAQGLRETKRLLVRDLVAHIDEHGEEMSVVSARLFGSEEAREAMIAFLNRKKK